MQVDDTARIPLRARDGSIRAYVIIDAADAAWVNQWRWSLSEGYAYRTATVNRRKSTVWLHRALLGCAPGDGIEVDHADRDKLNCRRQNLRKTNHAGNTQNVSPSGGTSIHRGVSWDKSRGKWNAYITVSGTRKNLGRFGSEGEAAEVARDARARMMPYATD